MKNMRKKKFEVNESEKKSPSNRRTRQKREVVLKSCEIASWKPRNRTKNPEKDGTKIRISRSESDVLNST